MEEGIFVSIIDRSDEAVVLVGRGAVKCHESSEAESCRWDREAVLKIKVSPTMPAEGVQDTHIKAFI